MGRAMDPGLGFPSPTELKCRCCGCLLSHQVQPGTFLSWEGKAVLHPAVGLLCQLLSLDFIAPAYK